MTIICAISNRFDENITLKFVKRPILSVICLLFVRVPSAGTRAMAVPWGAQTKGVRLLVAACVFNHLAIVGQLAGAKQGNFGA